MISIIGAKYYLDRFHIALTIPGLMLTIHHCIGMILPYMIYRTGARQGYESVACTFTSWSTSLENHLKWMIDEWCSVVYITFIFTCLIVCLLNQWRFQSIRILIPYHHGWDSLLFFITGILFSLDYYNWNLYFNHLTNELYEYDWCFFFYTILLDMLFNGIYSHQLMKKHQQLKQLLNLKVTLDMMEPDSPIHHIHINTNNNMMMMMKTSLDIFATTSIGKSKKDQSQLTTGLNYPKQLRQAIIYGMGGFILSILIIFFLVFNR